MSSHSSSVTQTNVRGSRTVIGVDVGVKRLITAIPADGDLDSALVIDGDHIRKRLTILVEATNILQSTGFDATTGQVQLVAALWQQIRFELFDAAARLVQYADQHPSPRLALEDLSHSPSPLWEYRTSTEFGSWLLPALRYVIDVKAHAAGIPIKTVSAKYSTRQCHHCCELTRVEDDTIVCSTPDCPVDEVCRDRSAAITIANRVMPITPEALPSI